MNVTCYVSKNNILFLIKHMNKCTLTFVKQKLVLNSVFLMGVLLLKRISYNQVWMAWALNLLLCMYASYTCHNIIDLIPFILAITVNPYGNSDLWLFAYCLYIIQFTTLFGFPLLGALGVLLPFFFMENNYKYGVYRKIFVIMTAIIIILFPRAVM